jgi:pimeloyl-ACP methyl ester carboxylesterase
VASIVAVSVATTVALMTVSRLALQGTQEKVIASPRTTLLPTLSTSERAALDYPPDILPGGRDVASPYGTIRVYEWGPEDGRKVLLIHGITTPSIALGAIAHGLVEKGCRVMLFDLWGRGYSDSSADLQHDDRLHATEILLAITSSPLSWTGSGSNGGFSIIGYSLGGGIAVNFTAQFSNLVTSLVLLAPAGVIRPEHMSTRSRLLYSMGIVPESLLKWGVRRRLGAGPMYRDENKKEHVRDVVGAEVEGDEQGPEKSTPPPSTLPYPPLSHVRPSVRPEQGVAFQLKHHPGFVTSFMSSVRFGPITGQHANWAQLSQRKDKTLLIAGTRDPVIIASEVKEDAERLIGAVNLDYKELDAAHDFPVTESTDVVRLVAEFWAL